MRTLTPGRSIHRTELRIKGLQWAIENLRHEQTEESIFGRLRQKGVVTIIEYIILEEQK